MKTCALTGAAVVLMLTFTACIGTLNGTIPPDTFERIALPVLTEFFGTLSEIENPIGGFELNDGVYPSSAGDYYVGKFGNEFDSDAKALPFRNIKTWRQ